MTRPSAASSTPNVRTGYDRGMRALLLVLPLMVGGILSGCDAAPDLPPPPAGAVPLQGDGPWETAYDQAVADWRRQASDDALEVHDYRLPAGADAPAILAAHAQALDGWDRQPMQEVRGRWTGAVWRRGGRTVAVAVFPARGSRDFDILAVGAAPKPR